MPCKFHVLQRQCLSLMVVPVFQCMQLCVAQSRGCIEPDGPRLPAANTKHREEMLFKGAYLAVVTKTLSWPWPGHCTGKLLAPQRWCLPIRRLHNTAAQRFSHVLDLSVVLSRQLPAHFAIMRICTASAGTHKQSITMMSPLTPLRRTHELICQAAAATLGVAAVVLHSATHCAIEARDEQLVASQQPRHHMSHACHAACHSHP